MEMHFTYTVYRDLLERLKKHEYRCISYDEIPQPEEKVVILRHDIDTDIAKAVQLAELEQKCGVHSTYFVLLTSDFYNVFSKKSAEDLQKILNSGHEIGLHFDEVRYPEIAGNANICRERILKEADILSAAIGKTVDKVSYHRPSQKILAANIEIPGMVNSYSQKYFKDYKYLSDSRRRWREPVLDIIESEAYDRLHILTHAFWYCDQEQSLHETIKNFVYDGNRRRYQSMGENITDLASIMKEEEL